MNPWKNFWVGVMGLMVLTDQLCYVLQEHALDTVVWEHYCICNHEHTWNWFPLFWKVYLAGIRNVLARRPWTLTLRRQAFSPGCQGLPRRASWLSLFSCMHPASPPQLTHLFIHKDEVASSVLISYFLFLSLASSEQLLRWRHIWINNWLTFFIVIQYWPCEGPAANQRHLFSSPAFDFYHTCPAEGKC